MIISINDDFDLNKIKDSGQCFRVTSDDNGTYRFITGCNVLYIKNISGSKYDISCSKREWDDVWFNYFDLGTDYHAIRSSVPKDDLFLKKCADAGAGIRILNQNNWEMLISFIISQRKSIPAIRSSIEKLCAMSGEAIKSDMNKDKKIFSFPTPKVLSIISQEDLASCSLGYRTPYVHDAAIKVSSKELELDKIAEYSDEQLFDALTKVKGVGTKVANCVMLFGYHRIGRAPVDTWIIKVINEKYNGISPFERYGKVSGIMQQYMFYGANKLKLLS